MRLIPGLMVAHKARSLPYGAPLGYNLTLPINFRPGANVIKLFLSVIQEFS